MTSLTAVRCLTLTFACLHTLTSFILPQFQSFQDENVARLLQYSGYGGILNARSPVFIAIAAIPLIASIGLYWLRQWGRVLFVISSALNAMIALSFGVSVSDALGSFFAYLTVLCAGALLAIVFLPTARDLFEPSTESR